jgi:hypothetical protein
MVHGGSRAEVMAKVAEIARIIGSDCRAHDVLFSTRILKKTGLRIGCVVLEDGSTAEQSLCRQLDLLHARLERTLARIADGRAQALARHEAFVRSKK